MATFLNKPLRYLRGYEVKYRRYALVIMLANIQLLFLTASLNNASKWMPFVNSGMLMMCWLSVTWIRSTWKVVEPRRPIHPENIELPDFIPAEIRRELAIAIAKGEQQMYVIRGEQGSKVVTREGLAEAIHPNIDAIKFIKEIGHEFLTSTLTVPFIKDTYYGALRGGATRDTIPEEPLTEMCTAYLGGVTHDNALSTTKEFLIFLSATLDLAVGIAQLGESDESAE